VAEAVPDRCRDIADQSGRQDRNSDSNVRKIIDHPGYGDKN